MSGRNCRCVFGVVWLERARLGPRAFGDGDWLRCFLDACRMLLGAYFKLKIFMAVRPR